MKTKHDCPECGDESADNKRPFVCNGCGGFFPELQI